MSCQILKLADLLGKETFVDALNELVTQFSSEFDTRITGELNFFAEKLHRKIFDYNYDLHKSELIDW